MQRLLPPYLFLLTITGMTLTSWFTGALIQPNFPANLVGVFVIVTGLSISVTGKNLFKKRATNLLTFKQPDIFVTDGVFNYSRNPMYLGFVIALIGFALVLGATWATFLFVVIFFIVADRWYIAFEEQEMHWKFGDEYKHYCQKVRRWI